MIWRTLKPQMFFNGRRHTKFPAEVKPPRWTASSTIGQRPAVRPAQSAAAMTFSRFDRAQQPAESAAPPPNQTAPCEFKALRPRDPRRPQPPTPQMPRPRLASETPPSTDPTPTQPVYDPDPGPAPYPEITPDPSPAETPPAPAAPDDGRPYASAAPDEAWGTQVAAMG
jgi:hypothetical protein